MKYALEFQDWKNAVNLVFAAHKRHDVSVPYILASTHPGRIGLASQ